MDFWSNVLKVLEEVWDVKLIGKFLEVYLDLYVDDDM